MGRRSDARERLLESAAALFYERGYNAVGVSDICTAAAVNKGSFYHFFPSKQELALAVVDAHWRDLRDQMERHLLTDGPPLRRLRRFCEAVHASHRRGGEECGFQRGCPLGNLAVEMSTQDPLVRDRVAQAFDGQIGYLERLLRQARERGEVVPDLEPRAAAEAVVALLEGRILLAKVRNDPAPLAGLADDLERMLGVRPATV